MRFINYKDDDFELMRPGLGLNLGNILGGIGGAILGGAAGWGAASVISGPSPEGGNFIPDFTGAVIGATFGAAAGASKQPLTKAASILTSAGTGYILSGANPMGALFAGTARAFSGGSILGSTTFGEGAAGGILGGMLGPTIGKGIGLNPAMYSPSFSNPLSKMYGNIQSTLGLEPGKTTYLSGDTQSSSNLLSGYHVVNSNLIPQALNSNYGYDSQYVSLDNGTSGYMLLNKDSGNPLVDSSGNPYFFSDSSTLGKLGIGGTDSLTGQNTGGGASGGFFSNILSGLGKLLGGAAGTGLLGGLLGGGQNAGSQYTPQGQMTGQYALPQPTQGYVGGGGGYPVVDTSGNVSPVPATDMSPDQAAAADAYNKAVTENNKGLDAGQAMMIAGALGAGLLFFSKKIAKSKSKLLK